jgi:lipopolysaccharide transport system ATP-binding protein
MIAIKFENISKQYQLGTIGTGTLSHDLNRWWQMNIRGKEDPYLKVGQSNTLSSKEKEGFVWALRDINLRVEQGEVLGIIGKNGAGKSTLLKLLSRVTAPTTGRIRAWGRVASLLEVGTGFHPEMTGRENIYMNGSIMGMTKAEINRKFDEIVDFAGVERYIDTPVKRYSSGMTVRLGFAIAAHLEPEILVVDEVLAVGDAEFQKKAIGKMDQVSKSEGRTVLFVSHNMGAVRKLCPKGIVLENGSLTFKGEANEAIEYYLRSKKTPQTRTQIIKTNEFRRGQLANFVVITYLELCGVKEENVYATNDPIRLRMKVMGLSGNRRFRVAGSVFTSEDTRIGVFFSKDYFEMSQDQERCIEFEIRNHNLSVGEYYLSLSIGTGDHTSGNIEFDILYEVFHFEIRSEMNNDDLSTIIKWNKDWGNILFSVNAKELED